MAIVGDKRWQEWMKTLVKPLYAGDAKLFKTEDMDQAWNWLREED